MGALADQWAKLRHLSTRDDELSLEEAAQAFAAAGSEPRLEVLRDLIRAGEDGLSIGVIQNRLGMPGSTLSHHLRFLTSAGLVEQEKSGRTVVNRANFARIESLAAFLLHECCFEDPAYAPDDTEGARYGCAPKKSKNS
ncbi:MAG: metalloregulator ArsR/SmtB family transcription factor [Pseudomonadota bacterium]